MDRGHARRTYDRIADHFAATRENPWPEVEQFLDGVAADLTDRPGARVGLDVGCGNGRHAELLAERVERVVGVDASRAILEVARDRLDGTAAGDQFHPVQADAATLPLVSDGAHVAVYVATLHHLRDRATRVASLDELARVLAPGAPALVSAWSTEHDRFHQEGGFDTTLDWTLPDGETVPRFYHIYDPGEFERDLADSALEVEAAFVSSGNCYARCRGPPDSEGA